VVAIQSWLLAQILLYVLSLYKLDDDTLILYLYFTFYFNGKNKVCSPDAFPLYHTPPSSFSPLPVCVAILQLLLGVSSEPEKDNKLH